MGSWTAYLIGIIFSIPNFGAFCNNGWHIIKGDYKDKVPKLL